QQNVVDRADFDALVFHSRADPQAVDRAVEVKNEVPRMEKKLAGAQNQDRRDEQAERAQDECSDQGRTYFFSHRCSSTSCPRVKNARTFGSSERASSSRG